MLLGLSWLVQLWGRKFVSQVTNTLFTDHRFYDIYGVEMYNLLFSSNLSPPLCFSYNNTRWCMYLWKTCWTTTTCEWLLLVNVTSSFEKPLSCWSSCWFILNIMLVVVIYDYTQFFIAIISACLLGCDCQSTNSWWIWDGQSAKYSQTNCTRLVWWWQRWKKSLLSTSYWWNTS